MKDRTVKILLAIVLVPLLSALGYAGYQKYLAPLPPTPTSTPAPAAQEEGPALISAEGKVVPHSYVQLAFSIPGVVEELYISEGQQVKTGQLLALQSGRTDLEAAIAAAQLELTSAQHTLDALYEHQELASAEAQQAVVELRENVNEAERVLRALNSTATPDQIQAAESAVVLAEQQVERTKKSLADQLKKPEGNAQRAAAELAVYAAERQYYFAVSYLNSLKGVPSELTIERAEASLALAQAQLAEAEKKSETLQDGPDPDDVELALARVENAQAQLEAVEEKLQDLELRAPFDGTVVSLMLKKGQIASPTLPQVLVADLTRWQVETTDLTEVDAALIEAGMQAAITLNAFPEHEFEGQVSEISLLGEEQRGLVTYKVTLDIQENGLPLLWEMTAFVDIKLP